MTEKSEIRHTSGICACVALNKKRTNKIIKMKRIYYNSPEVDSVLSEEILKHFV